VPQPLNTVSLPVLRAALLLSLLYALCPSAGAQLQRDQIEALLPIQLDEADWRDVMAGQVVRRLIEVEGSPVKQGVAIGIVDALPDRVYRVITDNARFAEFMPYVKESTVEPQPDGSIINYQYLKLPFVADREYKIRIVNTTRETNGVVIRESAWTHVKGPGNIDENHGAWQLVEFPPGKTLVIYEVLTDPGGMIPTFLKNSATKKSLPALLKSVRERVADPRYDADP